MKNKVIAVTAPLPDLVKPGFDKNELRDHGMIFEDGSFVSYAEMNTEQFEALRRTELDECDVAIQKAYTAVLKLSPEDQAWVLATLSPKRRAQLKQFISETERNQ